VRMTDRWEGVVLGRWLADTNEGSDPLYHMCLWPDGLDEQCAGAPVLVNKLPTGCFDSGRDLSAFTFIDKFGTTLNGNGTWLVDGPSGTVWETYPRQHWGEYAALTKPALVAKGPDGSIVGTYRYYKVRVFRKEKFRTWVVTYYRENIAEDPFNSADLPEEIIPLRENSWELDVDSGTYLTGNPDFSNGGQPDPQKRRATTPGQDYPPQHVPITGYPYPNATEVESSEYIPFGGTVTLQNNLFTP